MVRKERIIWGCLLILVVVVSSLYIFQNQSKLRNLENKNATLSSENTLLKEKNEDYSATANGEHDNNTEFQKDGHSVQLNKVVADLKLHPELIPHDGILGGTMGFYDDNNIKVLTNRWVIANFSDGHVEGYMLLNYSINEGKISWKVIDSYML